MKNNIKAISFSKIQDKVGTQIEFTYDDKVDVVGFEKELDFETLKYINSAMEQLLRLSNN